MEGENEWRKNENSEKWSWSESTEFDEAVINESEEERIRRERKSNEGQVGGVDLII